MLPVPKVILDRALLLTDERNRAIDDQALLDKLSQAIVACVDGETDHGKKEARH